MVQLVNPTLPSASILHMEAHFLAASLVTNNLLTAWKSSTGWSNALGPCNCVGNQEEAPSLGSS